ncbi:MAG: LptA/OstA family protein [Chthoniobacterales bacterium]
MNAASLLTAIFVVGSAGLAHAQGAAPATLNKKDPVNSATTAPKTQQSPLVEVGNKQPAAQTAPPPTAASAPATATTTIYADEASFDSAKYIGIFTGHVIVNDPRFNVQSDKMTIYISKQEKEGLEKTIAEGNVAVVRDRPDPKGGPPTRAVGRAEKAIYTAKDGNVELTGSPRVQQGLNTHVATTPDTVMVLNESGHLQTHGPSRTEIRQESKMESPKR